MRVSVLVVTTLLSFNLFAHPYYAGIKLEKVNDLQNTLFKILTMKHLVQDSGAHKLNQTCLNTQSNCIFHKQLSYKAARRYLFNTLHARFTSKGHSVEGVYCQREYTINTAGSNSIPNGNRMNCEHTWPQSKFNKGFDAQLQKTDLHHLYPTDSRANSERGNMPFGDVEREQRRSSCAGTAIGSTELRGATSYEPPANHKGNIARSLFYFSVRYKMKIDSKQEYYLKKWHHEDPVDEFEQWRNNEIYKIQGTRNPFIDHPHLVENIADF